MFKNNFKNNNSHAPFKNTIVLKNQPCAFFGINHTSLRIYKIFTFVKSSHLRIELQLRMLRRSLRRWCRSSDDELHLRRLHMRRLHLWRWCRSSDDELRGRRLGGRAEMSSDDELRVRAMYLICKHCCRSRRCEGDCCVECGA